MIQQHLIIVRYSFALGRGPSNHGLASWACVSPTESLLWLGPQEYRMIVRCCWHDGTLEWKGFSFGFLTAQLRPMSAHYIAVNPQTSPLLHQRLPELWFQFLPSRFMIWWPWGPNPLLVYMWRPKINGLGPLCLIAFQVNSSCTTPTTPSVCDPALFTPPPVLLCSLIKRQLSFIL